MTDFMTVQQLDIIDRAIVEGRNCYCFRPSGEKARYGISDHLLKGIHGGFVIYPFDCNQDNVFTIPDSDSETPAATLEVRYPFPKEETNIDRYISNVRTAADIHKNDGGKTVISRIFLKQTYLKPSEIFIRLCNLYPESTVMLFHTRPTGLWVCASPELLLCSDGKQISTVSLAGTRPFGIDGSWDEKNMEEQRIVTDYIVNTLQSNGLNPHCSNVMTRPAGPVEHLCTDITAPCDQLDTQRLTSLLTQLSPTPALGGFPKADSLRLISDLEDTPRGYYGGFAGYISGDGKFRLNVMVRCARIEKNNAAIYVGGGITGKSNPESELLETQRKGMTIATAL